MVRRLKPLAALILLLAGWLADPLARGLLDTAGCGMVCCTEDDRDSCAMHPPGDPDSAATSLGRSSQFSTPCRGTCSSRLDTGRSHLQLAVPASFILNADQRETTRIDNFRVSRNHLLGVGPPPRSPPSQS
ncbi:MAG: hypothetical protein ACKOB4_02625 [Acidobacteriota bacterium]